MYYREESRKRIFEKKSSATKYIEETLVPHLEETLVPHLQLVDSQDVIHIKGSEELHSKKICLISS